MVGIIIVGYNSKVYLKDCLDSIYKSTVKDVAVFFVDNNSQDDSIRYIKQHYPRVYIIQNDENKGFAQANNQGIKSALKSGSEHVLLLNPDTILDAKCLELLIKNARNDTILQPMVLLYTDQKTDLVNTSGSYLHFLGISYCDDYKKPASHVTKSTITTASGAAMVIPREILERIGLLEESFFMYHEDTELCWRARMAGFEIKLVKEARVWHKYRFSASKNKLMWAERNRLLFLLKDFQLRTLVLIAPAVVFNEILVNLFAFKNRWLLKKWASYGSVIRELPTLITKRQQLIRSIPDRKLKRFIKSDIHFAEVPLPLEKQYNQFLRLYWALIYPLI